jgi:transposase InsO family protein
MIEPGHDRIPLSRQCELLGLPRASFYYQPHPITALEERLLRRIEEIYTRCPFYGVRRITAWLRRQGYTVNPKRIRRLMHRMGVKALYPKCNSLSRMGPVLVVTDRVVVMWSGITQAAAVRAASFSAGVRPCSAKEKRS